MTVSDLEVINRAIAEDSAHRHKAGIYWYAAQEGKLLFRDVKNVAVQSFYALIGYTLQSINQTNVSGVTFANSHITYSSTFTAATGGRPVIRQ